MSSEKQDIVLPLSDHHTVDYRLYSCYDAHVPTGGTRQAHIDTCWTMWYIRRGTVDLRWAGGQLCGRPGQAVFAGPHCQRDQIFTDGARIVSVRFVIEWKGLPHWQVPAEPWTCGLSRTHPIVAAALALVERTRVVGQEPNSNNEHTLISPAEHVYRRILFMQFIERWLLIAGEHGYGPRLRKHHDVRLAAAINVLDAQDILVSVPYEQMTSVSGLGRTQLDRLLGQALGCSPRRYLDKKLLVRSEHFLQSGSLSIKEIALRLGFTDSSHFAKWFRRQTGESPKAWQRYGGV